MFAQIQGNNLSVYLLPDRLFPADPSTQYWADNACAFRRVPPDPLSNSYFAAFAPRPAYQPRKPPDAVPKGRTWKDPFPLAGHPARRADSKPAIGASTFFSPPPQSWSLVKGARSSWPAAAPPRTLFWRYA